ncbi:MAG: hypothetical protein NE328_24660 [Lentisphaeraceae bacterium]|nr:hypothetical protein [Lentisphaeraceae bacterium]
MDKKITTLKLIAVTIHFLRLSLDKTAPLICQIQRNTSLMFISYTFQLFFTHSEAKTSTYSNSSFGVKTS